MSARRAGLISMCAMVVVGREPTAQAEEDAKRRKKLARASEWAVRASVGSLAADPW